MQSFNRWEIRYEEHVKNDKFIKMTSLDVINEEKTTEKVNHKKIKSKRNENKKTERTEEKRVFFHSLNLWDPPGKVEEKETSG